jgi:SsrA-binding protein
MAKPTKSDGSQQILQNRRASYNYELGERFEAGLVLLGSEVKTLRSSAGDLTDGWVAVFGGKAMLKGLYLPKLQHAAFGHDERRDRQLLLHTREIERLGKAINQEGLTVVPVRLYWKDGRVKAELALAKGKKMADKRQAIKERDLDREARVAMARGRRGE